MRTFHLKYSGDMLNAQGEAASGYIGAEILDAVGFVARDFLMDQAPTPGDTAYSDRLYSMHIEPRHIADADGLVVIRPYVRDSAFANGAERLTVIGRAGVGTDKIDLEACTRNDVAVFNAPGALIHSTASATMLLILALAKKLPDQERMARSGCWNDQPSVTGDDLSDLTLGIVGLGRISRELIRLLRPFDIPVMVYSRHADAREAGELGVTLAPDLDSLLRRSDVVCMLCGLNESTRGMIGEREFRLMKPSAYFVNTGRGELVLQEAMIRALHEGRIAGAGLDVYDKEPLPADNPLAQMDNVILTPHWLPTTRRVVREVMDTMSRGILRAATGHAPENVVNKAVLEMPGFQAKLARFAENK